MDAFKPTGPNVVIETLPMDEKSKGGIYIPESARRVEAGHRQENWQFGRVKAVGPGRRPVKVHESDLRTTIEERVPPQVKVGDRVLFNDIMILTVVQDSPRQVVCDEDHIMVVLSD